VVRDQNNDRNLDREFWFPFDFGVSMSDVQCSFYDFPPAEFSASNSSTAMSMKLSR